MAHLNATTLIAAAALAAASSPVLGAAWTLERGDTRAFVTSTFTYGDHGFDADGNLVAVPEYRKFTLSAAVEHGVRPWLTGFVRGELKEEQQQEEVSRYLIAPVSHSYGSIAGGARIRLYQTPAWVISTELTAFSGGYDMGGIDAPYDSPGVEVRILAGTGRTLRGRPVFMNIEAAYRQHVEADDPDEVKLDLTVGGWITPRWMLLAQSFSTFDLGGDSLGQDHKLSASVVRRVNDRLSIEATGLATVYGENAIQEYGGRIGFWYDF